MKKKKPSESQQVKRLRNRLKKHLDNQESAYSPEAIQERADSIRAILYRNASTKVDLKEKSLRLFDKNRHPAKEAKATERLRKLIKKDYFLQ